MNGFGGHRITAPFFLDKRKRDEGGSMSRIRMKVHCESVLPHGDGGATVHMAAAGHDPKETLREGVYKGWLMLSIKPGGPTFEQGQDYFADFTKAEAPIADQDSV